MLVIGLTVLTGAAATGSRKQVVLIRPNNVEHHADPDTTVGGYYTVTYSAPQGLLSADLDRVVLEMYVDVSSIAREEYVNEAPVFQVYALREPFGSILDPETLDSSTRAARPIAAGSVRRIVIDVTQIVRAHLQGTLENYGLVIGSLTGMREGEFVLLANRLPEGAVGQLHFFSHNGVTREQQSK